MSKNKTIGMIRSGILAGIAGMFLLLFSVNLGGMMADEWIMKRGGADPAVFQVVLQGYINAFLAMGSILFALGLFAAIFGYVHMQKKAEHSGEQKDSRF